MIEALGIALPLGVIIGGFCYMCRVDAMVKIEQLRTERARLWVSEIITTRREDE